MAEAPFACREIYYMQFMFVFFHQNECQSGEADQGVLMRVYDEYMLFHISLFTWTAYSFFQRKQSELFSHPCFRMNKF